MAWARPRKLASGTWWYVIDDRKKAHAAGVGKEGRELAQEWAAAMNRAKRLERAGFPPEDVPAVSDWTLADLFAAHLADARRRGLRIARPQFQGKRSKLESHWSNLLAFFGEKLALDALSDAGIRSYIEAREAAKIGPSTINRDLSVLRGALRLARESAAAGYAGDPFASIRPLAEAHRRRQPIALSERDCRKLLRICWSMDQRFGAFVELLLLTASRLNETPTVSGGRLRYPPYKRGRARIFTLRGGPEERRLAKLAQMERHFDRRRLWTPAVAALGRPELRPHDLRHTALTLEGKRPGASLLSLQKLGGWKSAAMAARYLHPDAEAIRPVRVSQR